MKQRIFLLTLLFLLILTRTNDISAKETKLNEDMVDRFFPSSKKCCKCGRIKKELKLSERVYHCECGNEMDRDCNAAINIREEARRMLTA